MADREPLEGPTALSESVLWSLQREYYQREGIKAWSRGVVPDMITTNAVMGAAYARMVVAFLRDWRADAGSDPADPIHIVELGAGSGRFAHHFLTKLAPRLETPGLAGLPVRHVMTDLPGGNVDRWRRHPFLRRHVAAGRLDFATLDGTRPDALHLVESGAVLREGSTTAPLVVIANYFFDSLPLDAFVVDDGELHEHVVSVSAPRAQAGRPPGMEDLELEWSRRRVGDRLRYRDAEIEALLRGVTAGGISRSVLLPTYAINLVRELRRLTSGPLLLLSADKGYSVPSRKFFADGPYMATHGSVSFMVDYSVLAAYIRRRHGLALLPRHDAGSLTVAAFVLHDTPSNWWGLRECYRDAVEVGGPDDFFSIDQLLSDGPALPAGPHLLARLRSAEWDPSVFQRVFPALMVRATTAEPEEREAIRDAVDHVERLYFPIGEAADIPFAMGMLRWRTGDAHGGLRLLRWSEQLHGPDPDRSFALALCHLAAGDLPAAIDATATALNLDPGFLIAGEFGAWLTGEGRSAVGVDPIEWGAAVAVSEKVDGYRAFRTHEP